MGGINSGRHHSPAVIDARIIQFDRELAYARMLPEARLPWCWACGRGGGWRDKPLGWFGPWLVERAHIIAGNRHKDVRAVVLLCSLCHKIQHGERIVLAGQRVELPRLLREHLMWLKHHRDPANYDYKFLQDLSINKLPRMCRPPRPYMVKYDMRRGNLPA